MATGTPATPAAGAYIITLFVGINDVKVGFTLSVWFGLVAIYILLFQFIYFQAYRPSRIFKRLIRRKK